jgi:hypothetical protein
MAAGKDGQQEKEGQHSRSVKYAVVHAFVRQAFNESHLAF